MASTEPRTALELRSRITLEGDLHLSLERAPIPEPTAHEVVVRVEASPINPSDLGLLLGPADPARAVRRGTGDESVLAIPIESERLRGFEARLGQSLPIGNEGAGVVVAAGSAVEAQSLVGRTVGLVGGAAWSQFRVVPAAAVVPFAPGTAPAWPFRSAAGCCRPFSARSGPRRRLGCAAGSPPRSRRPSRAITLRRSRSSKRSTRRSCAPARARATGEKFLIVPQKPERVG